MLTAPGKARERENVVGGKARNLRPNGKSGKREKPGETRLVGNGQPAILTGGWLPISVSLMAF